MGKYKNGNQKKFGAIAKKQQSGASAGPNQFAKPEPTLDANGKIKKKNRRGKGSGKKFNLVFDREKRIDFVTGFRKRKDERRAEAKELLKEEKKKEKQEFREHKKQQQQNIEEQYQQLREIKAAEMGIDLPVDDVRDDESEERVPVAGIDDDDDYAFTKE